MAEEAGACSAELLPELPVRGEQFPHRHRTAAGRGKILVRLLIIVPANLTRAG